MKLATLLGALPVVGPVLAVSAEFKALYDAGVNLLSEADQETAKAAYADLVADNDEGHRRLQAKLAEAAKR